jgi:hypothetical protein
MKEVTAKAGVGTQEVAKLGDAVQELKSVKAAPGGARLDVPGVGGPKPGSTVTTQAIVEVIEARTSICDAGRADVEESREVVEAPPDAGKEAAQLESQPAWEKP